MSKNKRNRKNLRYKRRMNKRKVYKVKLFNREISFETLFKWIVIIILLPLPIQAIGKLIKLPFIIYFISEYIFFLNILAIFMTFIIALIYTKSYLESSKRLILSILIISISINLVIIKEALRPMTKDLSVIVTGKYVESEFYITDIRRSGYKNVITSNYVTAKDIETGKIIDIEFYYSPNIFKGEIKRIRYLPNSNKGVISQAVGTKP